MKRIKIAAVALIATAAMIGQTNAEAATPLPACFVPAPVRYSRILDLGSVGPDVVAVRMALRLPGGPFVPYSPRDARAVAKYQHYHPHLLRPYTRWRDLRHDVLGTVGRSTYRSLLTLPCLVTL